jgi:hypothetical protein
MLFKGKENEELVTVAVVMVVVVTVGEGIFVIKDCFSPSIKCTGWSDTPIILEGDEEVETVFGKSAKNPKSELSSSISNDGSIKSIEY